MENIFTAFLNTFSDPYKRSAGMIQTWLNGAKPEVAFILPPDVMDAVPLQKARMFYTGMRGGKLGARTALLVPERLPKLSATLRVLRLIGVKTAVMAADVQGLKNGGMALVQDHIRLSPLSRELADMWRRPLKTPDPASLYDKNLNKALATAAHKAKAKLQPATLAARAGIPATPAEQAAMKKLGADIMSPDIGAAALAAAASGMRFAAIGYAGNPPASLAKIIVNLAENLP